MATEYVLPDATISTTTNTSNTPEITSEIESQILALDTIDEWSVRKLLKSSRKYARKVLSDMAAEDKLKTKSERIAELNPVVQDMKEI